MPDGKLSMSVTISARYCPECECWTWGYQVNDGEWECSTTPAMVGVDETPVEIVELPEPDWARRWREGKTEGLHG